MAKQKEQFEKYVDPTGELSNKELKWSKLYIMNKLALKQAFVFVLGTICSITIGFSLISIGEYLIFGYFDERDARNGLTLKFSDYPALRSLYTAEDLSFSSTEVYRSGTGKFDLITPVINRNERYKAIVEYHYTHATGSTEKRNMVVMPGEEQRLSELGLEVAGALNRATLEIDSIKWDFISPHYIKDVAKYIDLRTSFLIEEVQISDAGANSGVDLDRVQFDLTNETVYSFWDAEFLVELERGGTIQGVFLLSVPEFRAGETRQIDFRSFANIGGSGTIKLIPQFDVFDQNIYLPVGE